MKVRLRLDPGRVNDDVRRAITRKFPFAVANAVNRTADDMRTNTLKRIRKRFHKPVPYMEKTAVFRYRASPRRLVGAVGIKDHQASMFRWQEKGGLRYAKRRRYSGRRGSGGGKMIPVPANISLNAAGNMRMKAIQTALRKRNVFQAGDRENLHPGVYRRERDDSVTALVIYAGRARYRKRFGWFDMAQKTVRARLVANFRRAVSKEFAAWPHGRNRW